MRAEHQIRKQIILLAVSKQGKFISGTQYNKLTKNPALI